MLLNAFRNNKIHLISTALIALAMMAKMLVPIAHASNVSNSDNGFLASICSGNKIVLVALDLPTDKTPSNVGVTKACAVCNVIEHDAVSTPIEPSPFLFNKKQTPHTLADNAPCDSPLSLLRAIRAPPVHA